MGNEQTASALLRLAENLERQADRNDLYRLRRGLPVAPAGGYSATRRARAAELRKQAATLAAQPEPQTTGGTDA